MRTYNPKRQGIFFLLVVLFGGVGFFAGTMADRSLRDPLALATFVIWLGLFVAVLTVRDFDRNLE